MHFYRTRNQSFSKSKPLTGFTLFELLIVISIIAILSVAIILVLNPAETLKKTRDAQRISDLNTLKTALGIYVATVANPNLGTYCLGTGVNNAKIYYSKPQSSDPDCGTVDIAEGTDATGTFGNTAVTNDFCIAVTPATNVLVDGSGWVPVNLSSTVGGSPMPSLPVDPVNSVSGTNGNAPSYTDLVYRYACQKTAASPAPSNVFEINATLESTAFGPGGDDDKSTKDGGDNDYYYEVGTSLRLIGTTTRA